MGHILSKEEKDTVDVMEDAHVFYPLMDEILGGNIPGLKYAGFQIEAGEKTGRLHIQIYTEWKQSLRESEVVKRIPGEWDYRAGTRAEARNYCTKAVYNGEDKGRVEGPFEFGEFKPDGKMKAEDRPKARALRYLIVEGLTPSEIALVDPEAFFSHHAAILATYRALQLSTKLDEGAAHTPLGGEEE